MVNSIDVINKLMEKDGGSLDLTESEIEYLPDNLIVHGFLSLRGSKIKQLPENLIVEDFLDINETQISEIPKSLVVKGDFFCSTLMGEKKGKPHRVRIYERQVIFDRFICCSRRLIEFKRVTEKLGYTIYVGVDKTKNVVIDGQYYSVCSSIKSGILDVMYKKNRDKAEELYSNYTLDTLVNMSEVIVMYRTVTGACRKGSESFLESLHRTDKQVTVQEIIRVTRGQPFGDRFELFFTDRGAWRAQQPTHLQGQ